MAVRDVIELWAPVSARKQDGPTTKTDGIDEGMGLMEKSHFL